MDKMPINFVPPKFVPPTDAEIHKDIQYASQGHVRQRLDLYLPKPEARRPGRIPLIVYIHGTLNGAEDPLSTTSPTGHGPRATGDPLRMFCIGRAPRQCL